MSSNGRLPLHVITFTCCQIDTYANFRRVILMAIFTRRYLKVEINSNGEFFGEKIQSLTTMRPDESKKGIPPPLSFVNFYQRTIIGCILVSFGIYYNWDIYCPTSDNLYYVNQLVYQRYEWVYICQVICSTSCKHEQYKQHGYSCNIIVRNLRELFV